ncbi:MAG TPA: TonB-dependent receptor, partial [Gemmatimonadaceae bacterium]
MFSALAARRRHFATAFLVGGMLAHPSRSLSAQGLSGASVQGAVVQASGLPVEHPVVVLMDVSTGSIRRTIGNTKGGFRFENVSVGGPYRIEARSVGFEPTSIEGIALHLGDRLVQQIVMKSQTASEIGTVIVHGTSLRDAGAGGPVYSIPGEAVRRLPLVNRDFVGLLATVPQATVSQGALSISGQHSRFNAIQVDGASSEDLFGVNVTPGQSSGARAISIEAIDEVRVLVAPFDVRQGWFSGGLINAVTRSGTNELHGSVFSSFSEANLVGRDTAGARVPTFKGVQYGGSIGGPIIRNRLHFFAVADVQSRRESFVGPTTTNPTTGISEATAERAASIFRDRYGFDAGDPSAPPIRQPNTNVFLKLSGQPSVNHQVELTETWVDATTDILNRTVRNRNDRDGWQLSNSGSESRSRSVTSRGRLMSSAGPLSNELVASFGTIADESQSKTATPLFLVQGDLPNTFLAGGSVKGAQGTETRQQIVEVADNLSWSTGEHLITVGSQNEFVHIRDNLFPGAWGVWTFGGVDALEIAQPLRYEVALPLRAGGPLADYSASLLSGYVQDRWSVGSRLTLVGGLRLDAPYFQHPQQNPLLLASPLGRIDTSLFPSGNRVLSPRMGFSLEMGHDRSALLRGGVGAFTGRPLLAWLTGAYSNTGLEQTLLVCNLGDGVPRPTTDIDQLPTRCLNAPPNRSAVPSITFFPRDFRFQQAIKYVLGFDRDFGKGLLASIDAIHTRTRNSLVVDDVNLADRGVDSE